MKIVTPKVGMSIEFTYEELTHLVSITGKISGNVNAGPRKTATTLYRMLQQAGVPDSPIEAIQSMKFPVD